MPFDRGETRHSPATFSRVYAIERESLLELKIILQFFLLYLSHPIDGI